MPILNRHLDGLGRPIIELYVGPPTAEADLRPPTPPIPVRALVDTGASTTNIGQWVLDRLGLWPVGRRPVHTASTGSVPLQADLYMVDIALAGEETGPVATDLPVFAAKDLSGSGVDVLLGRDLLGQGLLIFDGLEKRFTLVIESPRDRRFPPGERR